VGAPENGAPPLRAGEVEREDYPGNRKKRKRRLRVLWKAITDHQALLVGARFEIGSEMADYNSYKTTSQ
jgi:hypothetical protein